MENYNIKATLSNAPKKVLSQMNQAYYISRGASATISYNISGPLYDLTNIDQITFMLSQNRKIIWYRMFNYITKTLDTEFISGKTYYKNIKLVPGDVLQCTGTAVSDEVGNPSQLGYYESISDEDSTKDTKYLIDPHFSYFCEGDLECISLNLFPEDTLQFKPTGLENPITCELALRLNTELIAELGNRESIIVEQLPPIVVVDTLYSKLLEA